MATKEDSWLINKIGLIIFTVLIFIIPSAAIAQSVTITSIGDYNMSEFENLTIAKERAVTTAIHNAAKQSITYVEDYVRSHNLSLSPTEMSDLSAAILIIKDKQFEQRVTDTNGIYIKATIVCLVDVDNISSLATPSLATSHDKVDEHSDSSMQLLAQGLQLYGTGDFNTAIQAYTKAIQLDPNNAKIYNNRSAAYQQIQLYDLAITDCNMAISIDPHYVNAYINRGNSYQNKKLLDQAIADFTQAIALNPNSAVAYNNRGSAYKDKGMLDPGLRDCTRALTIDPHLGYHNRGLIYQQLKQYDQAIADYTQAIYYTTNDYLSYLERSNVYLVTKKFDQVIADIDKAITLMPPLNTYAHAYDIRGLAYLNKADYNQALSDFSQAIVYDNEYFNAYLHRSNSYILQGKYYLAITDLDQALTINSQDSNVYFLRGYAYKAKNELNKALSDFDLAITYDPSNALAYFSKALIFDQTGRYQEAIVAYQVFLKYAATLLDDQYIQHANKRLKVLGLQSK